MNFNITYMFQSHTFEKIHIHILTQKLSFLSHLMFNLVTSLTSDQLHIGMRGPSGSTPRPACLWSSVMMSFYAIVPLLRTQEVCVSPNVCMFALVKLFLYCQTRGLTTGLTSCISVCSSIAVPSVARPMSLGHLQHTSSCQRFLRGYTPHQDS